MDALLEAYDDDEIGDLEHEAANVRGGSDVEAFAHVFDDYFGEGSQTATGEPGSGGAAAGAGKGPDGDGDLDKPVPLSEPARRRLELVPEEDYEPFSEHPFLAPLGEREAVEPEPRWDVETIVSTYTNTENHPTLVRAAQRPRSQRIALSKHGFPVGALDRADVARAGAGGLAAAALYAPNGAAANGSSADGSGDGDSESDEESVSGQARPRKESADEKRARKQAVKAQRRARREEKKATKSVFAAERTRHVHAVARAPPTGMLI
mmetsp:Transcript_14213/g.48142  ORF Transcript_14213/g.48142 Transcript_14213/m.48142 type:complete len:265 (-) Transcript_14213:32-826(-)